MESPLLEGLFFGRYRVAVEPISCKFTCTALLAPYTTEESLEWCPTVFCLLLWPVDECRFPKAEYFYWYSYLSSMMGTLWVESPEPCWKEPPYIFLMPSLTVTLPTSSWILALGLFESRAADDILDRSIDVVTLESSSCSKVSLRKF